METQTKRRDSYLKTGRKWSDAVQTKDGGQLPEARKKQERIFPRNSQGNMALDLGILVPRTVENTFLYF